MATLYFNGAVNGDWNTLASFATGSISFSGQPADGDTLTINGIVFEFDNDSSTTGGNVAVAIGVDLTTTLSTLESLVEANVSVGATINGTSLDLISNTAGGGSNYNISASSSVITTGNMSGGDGNWWLDDTFTTPATSLPTSTDSVIASANISTNNGTQPTITNFTIEEAYLGIYLTVTGTATFNGSSTLTISLTGNAEFNDNSINSFAGSVSGNAVFNNNAINRGVVGGTITWNSSYPSDGSLTYYFNGAVNNDWNTVGNWWLDSGHTIPLPTIFGINLVGLPQSIDSVIASATISSNSGSNPTIVNFTVNGNVAVGLDVITVSGMATFNDASTMGQIIGSSKFINGNATFNNTSILLGGINGNATFNNSAICAIGSNVSGDAEFNDSSIKRGNVGGTITWNSSYPNDYSLIYYFDNVVDDDWNNLGNWWINEAKTIAVNTAIGLPTSIDSVVFIASDNLTGCTTNSGPEPTIKNLSSNNVSGPININITILGTATFETAFGHYGPNNSVITGNCVFNNGAVNQKIINGNATFNQSSFNDITGDIQKSATFNNTSYNDGNVYPYDGSVIFNQNAYNNGTVYLTAVFNGESYNSIDGEIIGTTTFNNVSYNSGTITGDATFYDTSYNNGVVTGNATFNGASYNHGTVGTDEEPPTTTHAFNDSSINYSDGIIYGDATFNDSSFIDPTSTYNGSIIIGTRTPYPIPRGINGSSILGLV